MAKKASEKEMVTAIAKRLRKECGARFKAKGEKRACMIGARHAVAFMEAFFSLKVK